ncbi:MAG TPA: hypothetical protein VGO62_04140 [Myxococcota bacterium]|jgi:hypothetical protein
MSALIKAALALINALVVVVVAAGCCCPGGPTIPSAAMRDRAPEQAPPVWTASAQAH